MKPKIPRWLWGIWVAWTVVSFAVLESIALVNGNPNDTLTMTIRYTLPGWLVFTGLGALGSWLAWHFVLTYFNKGKGR